MKKDSHQLLTEQHAQDTYHLFKALADPTRIKIMHLLAEEECSVNHIADILQMNQSAVSHQLRTLRQMKLVKYRRSGNHLYYSCDDSHVIELLNQALSHSEHT
ncbi:ArsR family transcriptional regulator [Sinobaca qinghaiensis]|uniref:ArsR family transcriptional regulator n=1 Tax=Sinobaca qinghaiensis TaxID=342944 RepID=A0A419UX75_9BACL|nr:metalloregulator ArsR/SmtB family transcription factor [Sinobaca qinghaiensis]RKD69742.1 ArsR family transcriptional regulator [Sinobaca qinghaiensis]